MPHPSIKNERVYRALRKAGYSKTKSAKISNAAANGSLNRSGGKKKGSKKRGKR